MDIWQQLARKHRHFAEVLSPRIDGKSIRPHIALSFLGCATWPSAPIDPQELQVHALDLFALGQRKGRQSLGKDFAFAHVFGY